MMEKMIELIKNNNMNVPRILLMNYKSFNIGEKELIVLIFLVNENSKTFDPKSISDNLKYPLTDVLELIGNLSTNDLISIDIMKNNGIMEETVSFENLYKKLAYLVVNNNEEVKVVKTNIYDLFEKEFGRTLSPIEYELINGWLEASFSEELITCALKEAVFNGVSNLRYIDKILYEWKKKGIENKDCIEKEKIDFKNKKNSNKELFDYDWLNDNEE